MKYNQFPQPVIKENADYTIREITNVIKKYGPRESGGENCFATQKHLKKELDQFCDETHFEEYQLAPKGAYIYTKIVPIISIIAFIVIGALMYFDILSVYVSNVILFNLIAWPTLLFQNYDKICKKATAHNLIATRKPRGEVKKKIILVGNVDAAYEQSLVRRFKKKSYSKLAQLGIAMNLISTIIAMFSSLSIILIPFFGFADLAQVNTICKYAYFFHIITIIFLIKTLFAIDFKTISPGAIDNLTGAYSALGALRMLDMAGVDFESTEVTALITDGKEAACAGTKAYVDAHKDELDENTYVIAIQSLATEEPRIEKASKQLSDITWFTKAGVIATLITAEDANADYYHNRRDNADALNQKAIEAGFGSLLEKILEYDEQ